MNHDPIDYFYSLNSPECHNLSSYYKSRIKKFLNSLYVVLDRNHLIYTWVDPVFEAEGPKLVWTINGQRKTLFFSHGVPHGATLIVNYNYSGYLKEDNTLDIWKEIIAEPVVTVASTSDEPLVVQVEPDITFVMVGPNEHVPSIVPPVLKYVRHNITKHKCTGLVCRECAKEFGSRPMQLFGEVNTEG